MAALCRGSYSITPPTPTPGLPVRLMFVHLAGAADNPTDAASVAVVKKPTTNAKGRESVTVGPLSRPRSTPARDSRTPAGHQLPVPAAQKHGEQVASAAPRCINHVRLETSRSPKTSVGSLESGVDTGCPIRSTCCRPSSRAAPVTWRAARRRLPDALRLRPHRRQAHQPPEVVRLADEQALPLHDHPVQHFFQTPFRLRVHLPPSVT